ncbi:hypothetical protein [Haloarcula amylolytica]|uniref:Uncharacterized protein n=1 Tax=Haloarcula amylolytica JCM 13557 TaxID=1227452 RepID=M0K7I6_9EURY|nr:hypothetical protein [Haloarcula amylolytica]EMA17166.1 hypothetical protein C442_17890 [Haloarcula amylolytica JCM 13557]
MKRGSSPEQIENSDGASDTARASTNRSMSINTRTGQKSSGTDRVWKWIDQSDNPETVPETWADNGTREDAAADEERYFAVETRPGLQLEFDTNGRGQATGVANRERPAIQTMYVTADGGRAVVIESQAAGNGDTVRPLSDWKAVISRPEGHGNTVDADARDAYRAVIRDLYPEEAEA